MDSTTIFPVSGSLPSSTGFATPDCEITAKRSAGLLQHLVNRKPSLFARHFHAVSGIDSAITWHSPVHQTGFAEYRDQAFLDRIGQSRLRDALRSFWPASGPRWDGLATTATGQVILVEAKAHLDELITDCKATPDSLRHILATFEQVKVGLKIPHSRFGASWISPYYQLCNRIAHLYFLRQHGVDARMVFLSFANAADVPNPVSTGDWKEFMKHIRCSVALDRHALRAFDYDIIIPASECA